MSTPPPWRLRAARLMADGWRRGQWSLDAIRERAETGDTESARDDRAILLIQLAAATTQAGQDVDETLTRLREDNAVLRDDNGQREAEIAGLRVQVNELTTRLQAAAEIVTQLRSLLTLPKPARTRSREAS